MEEIKDGGQCRFATTDDFLEIAEEVSGKKLDWFWEVYFRQASLPVLKAEIKNNTLFLEWQIENKIDFPLPVEVPDPAPADPEFFELPPLPSDTQSSYSNPSCHQHQSYQVLLLHILLCHQKVKVIFLDTLLKPNPSTKQQES